MRREVSAEHLVDDLQPHTVDRHVGAMIRRRRRELRISQERLAEFVGLTFQQVQKYERATNRVSASRLWDIARALGVPPSYFFEGLAIDEVAAPPSGETHQFLLSLEGEEIASMFPKVSEGFRRVLMELLRELVQAPVQENPTRPGSFDLPSGAAREYPSPPQPVL